ncbi:MAG TPA: TatD family hydrolase [Acidimicrobiales bacterium]|nr:TatD family hydrolase [Acidimicrobiales bacterium]
MSDAVLEWFDSHCHLQDEFLEADSGGGSPESNRGPTGMHATALNGALARASEAGVTRLVCVGTGATSSKEAVALARSFGDRGSVARAEGIEAWATVGLHPHDASDGVDAAAAVLDGALHADAQGQSVVVAVGECGLDYHYDHSPRDVQRDAFAAQIELAHRHGLALVIHTREAWDDTFDVLASAGVPERTVFHCFTGGPTEARRCLDIGASLSFSGIVTFKTAGEVREAAELCPLERLLVETDSPFLAPVPHRGSVNEPARVPVVGAAVALAKGLSAEVVAESSTRCARALFNI